MGFGDAVKLCFARCATFCGRSCRSEFWWWVVFSLLTQVFAVGLLEKAGGGLMVMLLSWGVVLPTFAVTARRLHDVGRSGWWQIGVFIPALLLLVPVLVPALGVLFPILALASSFLVLGGVVLLIFWLADPSEPGSNGYGPPPVPTVLPPQA